MFQAYHPLYLPAYLAPSLQSLLCYFWPIVFEVKMEENLSFKQRGREMHWFKEGKEDLTLWKGRAL